MLEIAGAIPPRCAEYVFYGLILYAIMGTAWGVTVPLLGAAGMTLLALYCAQKLTSRIATIFSPLALPLGCAILFVSIQIIIHGQSFLAPDNRAFFNWAIGLVIVQSLLLRKGFLNRFAIVTFVIGVLLLPHLVLNYGGVGARVERAGLEQGVGLANPNDLAQWFGFCCVYFIVVAMEAKRNAVRLRSWLLAAVCLFVVGLTVSRGSLLGIAVSSVLALRGVLKRGFVPVLFLVIIGSGLLFSGMFDHIIASYTERGTEETGRLLVWPLVIERFLASPYAGVGVDEVGTYVSSRGKETTPHNGFLYVGLASGIIPLTLFAMYWARAFRGAFYLTGRGVQDAPFQLPLVVYAFTICSLGAKDFMTPFVIVTLCNAIPRRATGIAALKTLSHLSTLSSRRHAKVRYKNERRSVYIGE